MSKNVIEISGKKIDLSKLSDAQLIKLKEKLEARENKCRELISKYEKKYPFLKEIDIDE